MILKNTNKKWENHKSINKLKNGKFEKLKVKRQLFK